MRPVVFFFNCEKFHEEKIWGKRKKWLTRGKRCGIMADGTVWDRIAAAASLDI